MTTGDIVRMCLQNLTRRKARTFLTVLGVVIGCCSIVIMVSMGIGMKESQERMLAEMGDLTIITVMPPQGGRGKIKLDDAAVKQMTALAGVETASPKMTAGDFTIKLYAGTNRRYVADWASLAGFNAEAMQKLGFQLLEGSFGTKGKNEAVVGQYLAYSFADSLRPEGSNRIDRWGAFDEATGKPKDPPPPYFDIMKSELTLEISNGGTQKVEVALKVTGRVKEDYAKGYETSEGLMLDLNNMKGILEEAARRLGVQVKKTGYETVIVKTTDISQVAGVEEQIRGMGYNTSSMESIRKPMEKEARQKQMMLGGLGAISLFVAAIGITNTMIMSISERTREIGIMKALGCFVKDIRVVFLTEAGAIGLIGGLVGCVVSLTASAVINLVSARATITSFSTAIAALMPGASRVSVVPVWLLGFAIVFSVFIGLGSGYYPANKAVKISALEAIKNSE